MSQVGSDETDYHNMSKEIEGANKSDHTLDVKVGEQACVITDDGMEYYFGKPEWAEKWYFSHRAITEDGETTINGDNRMPPQSVVAWANQNLGVWDFYNGVLQYITETGKFSVVVREKRSA